MKFDLNFMGAVLYVVFSSQEEMSCGGCQQALKLMSRPFIEWVSAPTDT